MDDVQQSDRNHGPASNHSTPRRRYPKYLIFVLPALPLAALGLPLGVFLPAHLNSYVGLGLATVGTIFTIVRLLDIIFDPVMGVLLDRTATRWGQCRPWLVTGTALIMLGALTIFWARPGASALILIAGLTCLYYGSSIVTLAHSAWATKLTSEYSERSTIWGMIQFVGSLGAFIIIGMPLISGLLGDGDAGRNVQLMGWLIVVLMPLTVLAVILRTAEPAAHVEPNAGAHSVRDYFRMLKNPNVARIIVSDAFIAVAQGTTSVLFIFFWVYVKNYTASQTSVFIAAYMLGGVLGVSFWVRIAGWMGKHRALMASLIAYAVIIPAAALIPPGYFPAILILQFFLGLTYAAGSFLLRAMASDVGDEIRLQTKNDHLGQIYALLLTTQKLGGALSVGLVYQLLDLFGFDARASAVNSEQALVVLQLLYVLFPGALMLASVVALRGYTLDKVEHARILHALKS